MARRGSEAPGEYPAHRHRSRYREAMPALPDWMRPPRAEGWFAEDLDHLPEAPRHTELIDGALVFVVPPQRSWHGRLVTALTTTLMAQAPSGVEVEREMTIRLDARNRPEPDLLLTHLPYDPDRTWYAPEDVSLVVEVVSPSPPTATARSSSANTRRPASRTTGASRTRTAHPSSMCTSSTNQRAPTRPPASSGAPSSARCPSRSVSASTSSRLPGAAEGPAPGQHLPGAGG